MTTLEENTGTEHDNPWWYMNGCTDDEKAYMSRLDIWLGSEFLNTSAAPRNNTPWFVKRTVETIRKHKKGALLVGITGHAGSGKDSALDFFKELKVVRSVRMAFADPLKSIAKTVGFTQEQLTDRSLKETVDEFWGISPRQFLQMCGTEMFRNIWRDDIWVKIAQKKIADLAKNDEADIVFVTDVRFPNEAEMIRDSGGIIVRITRPGNPNAIANTHASESQINDLPADLVITNDCGSAEEWSWKFTKTLMMHYNPSAFYS